MKLKSVRTNTYPLVVHCPAGINKNPLWRILVDAWEKADVKKSKCKDFDELTIITFNSQPDKGSLEKSLDKLGAKYIVLGKDINNRENYKKIQLLYDYLKFVKTPYLMVLDDYDLLMFRDPLEAVEKFKKMNCEILFNGDISFWPTAYDKYPILMDWKNFFDKVARGRWRYLNAGAYIAKTEFFRNFIKKLKVTSEGLRRQDDFAERPFQHTEQWVFRGIFKDFYPDAQIDYNSEIFFNSYCILASINYVKTDYLWTNIRLYLSTLKYDRVFIKNYLRKKIKKLIKKISKGR